jgi:hypothetical protein
MDPWRQSTLDAITILNRLYWEVWHENDWFYVDRWTALEQIGNAMRHLARPDRDVYPKTRRGSKRNPVTRK